MDVRIWPSTHHKRLKVHLFKTFKNHLEFSLAGSSGANTFLPFTPAIVFFLTAIKPIIIDVFFSSHLVSYVYLENGKLDRKKTEKQK